MSALRITVMAATMALLAGCNADERGHVVSLNKGVYKGASDTQLSDATREALKQRTQFQRFGADLNQAVQPAQAPATGAAIEGRVSGQNF
ncbi:MAG: hypothetical protein H7Y60_05335 [Rhodospirillaceae bacterium]|nr:hypothetical protein [Rhodospirillales bacterium]